MRRPRNTAPASAARTSSFTDFHLTNCGSLFLLRPSSPRAAAWIAERVVGDPLWFNGSLVIEWRYAEPIVDALVREDFTVEVNG